MGLSDSPYCSIQLMILAKEEAYGDRLNTNNPLQWTQVVENLPFNWDYDPSLPWVFKVWEDRATACEIYVYVHDARITGFSRIECWKDAPLFAKTQVFLGIQDSAHKHACPSTTPCPWAESVAHTDGKVSLLVSQPKCNKVKELVTQLKGMIESPSVQQKHLE